MKDNLRGSISDANKSLYSQQEGTIHLRVETSITKEFKLNSSFKSYSTEITLPLFHLAICVVTNSTTFPTGDISIRGTTIAGAHL